MKIEKLNENQIRCTLSRSDLDSRNLNLSELAYGSEKARTLFHEMIEKAYEDFGFETDDTPLMIEAIPLPRESLMLIITKVEDPDELDTRFSKFAPVSDDEDSNLEAYLPEGADEILDLVNTLIENQKAQDSSGEAPAGDKNLRLTVEKDYSSDMMRIYSFRELDDLIQAAHVLKDNYRGINSIYKDEKQGNYYLVINISEHTPEEYNKICNILTEYGVKVQGGAAVAAYYQEHYTCIQSGQALQRLATI